MNILVTGSAGFIGTHLCLRLLKDGHNVVGIDSLCKNESYQLKLDRLDLIGISKNCIKSIPVKSIKFSNFIFIKVDIVNKNKINKVFSIYKFDKVCHLAAQAGVRYSILNPTIYVKSNLVGFLNIIEAVRHFNIDHLVYASSSSVYGNSTQTSFSVDDKTDFPISLYAATKKSNEVIAFSYSHLFGFATTGLRFFTVYGPWGRPDMAYYLFANSIIKDKIIDVFNHGNLKRDFTYIDDIVEGITRVLYKNVKKRQKYKIYNLGNCNPVELGKFINILEKCLKKKANINYLPMQLGDVYQTSADMNEFVNDFSFKPKVSIEKGLKKFSIWFNNYKQ